MRVLFLNTTGGFFGGVEQNIYLAASGLAVRGVEVFFASWNWSGKELARFSSVFTEVYNVIEQPLGEIIAACAPDVIYIHKVESVRPVMEAAGDIPLVRMYHDHDVYCPRRHKYYAHNQHICTHRAGWRCYADLAFLERGPNGLRYASIGRKLAELHLNTRIGTAIAGSSYTKGELIRNGFDPDRIVVLPPCTAPSDHAPLPMPEDPSLLFVGQLIRGKGVDFLLEAYKKLVDRTGTAVPLHIVGTGNSFDALTRMAEDLGISASVTFHGWVSSGEIRQFYQEASLVVVPSRWPEPFGMIGPEAMFNGRPVVASRAGGIPDWLEDGVTGYLVPPGDTDALSRKIEELIDDPERARQFGLAGFERATARFGYDDYIDSLKTLLERSML